MGRLFHPLPPEARSRLNAKKPKAGSCRRAAFGASHHPSSEFTPRVHTYLPASCHCIKSPNPPNPNLIPAPPRPSSPSSRAALPLPLPPDAVPPPAPASPAPSSSPRAAASPLPPAPLLLLLPVGPYLLLRRCRPSSSPLAGGLLPLPCAFGRLRLTGSGFLPTSSRWPLPPPRSGCTGSRRRVASSCAILPPPSTSLYPAPPRPSPPPPPTPSSRGRRSPPPSTPRPLPSTSSSLGRVDAGRTRNIRAPQLHLLFTQLHFILFYVFLCNANKCAHVQLLC